MKLHTKLALFAALSMVFILGLFVLLLPRLVARIAFQNTNKSLIQQKQKVLDEIKQNGIDYYLQGDSVYGSYSMLKDEYISLEQFRPGFIPGRLETAQRLVDNDTITYRILTDTLTAGGKPYLLEIGKKTDRIKNDSLALQKTALLVILLLAAIILFIQLAYTSYLLSPLRKIISTRLVKAKFPFNRLPPPLGTTTSDFKYLDSSISTLMQQVHTAFEKEREFTSNASHELMTPISIMQSKIENMMMDPGIKDQQYVKLEETMHIVKRLKKIVNSLLLISRVENDQYIREDTVAIKELIQDIAEELSHRLEERQLETDLHSIALKNLNKDLLFQLFYNIIHNAIRYNKPDGKIIITDEYIPGQSYAVSVADTGVGIEQNRIDEIFNRFKKSPRHNGNGLGLAIVHSIAQYQNIKIGVESKAGEGTVFVVVFSKEHL